MNDHVLDDELLIYELLVKTICFEINECMTG